MQRAVNSGRTVALVIVPACVCVCGCLGMSCVGAHASLHCAVGTVADHGPRGGGQPRLPWRTCLAFTIRVQGCDSKRVTPSMSLATSPADVCEANLTWAPRLRNVRLQS